MRLIATMILCGCLVAAATERPAHGVPAPQQDGATATTEPADSTATPPEKMPASTTWERIAAFPGMVAYLPFQVLFGTAGALIKLNSETHIVPKIRDYLTWSNGLRGVTPVYTARSGGGLQYYAKDIVNEGSRFNGTLSFGLRRRQNYDAHYQRIELFGGAITTNCRVQFRQMPDESFFGLGPDSDEDAESNYLHKRLFGEIAIRRPVGQRTRAGVVFEYEHSIIEAGRDDTRASTTERFEEWSLPGIRNEASMAGVSLALSHDGRNRPFRPSSGFEIEMRGGIHVEPAGRDFGLTEVELDARQYIHLFRDRILQLRVAARMADPLPGRRIPFYRLSELGHVRTIRGYQRGRFRDRDMVLASLEYRYPVWRRLDALLFVEGGQVAGDIFDQFDTAQWATSFGGGFRVWRHNETLLRIELGKGEDGFRLHFILM